MDCGVDELVQVDGPGVDDKPLRLVNTVVMDVLTGAYPPDTTTSDVLLVEEAASDVEEEAALTVTSSSLTAAKSNNNPLCAPPIPVQSSRSIVMI